MRSGRGDALWRSVALWVLFAAAFPGCRRVAANYDDLSCPCVDGFVCDVDANLCVPVGQLGDTGGSVGGDPRAGDTTVGGGGGDPRVGDTTMGDSVATGDGAPSGDAAPGGDASPPGSCPGGRGPIEFDTANFTTDNDASFSWTHTTSGAQRLLLVAIAHRGSSVTVDSVTYDSVAMRRIDGAGTDPTVDVFALVGPHLGANTVRVELSGAEDSASGSVSLKGVSQKVWRDGPWGANTGSGSTASVTTTTVSDGAWVVDFVAADNTHGTPASPQIRRWWADRGEPHGFSSTLGPVVSADAVTMEWSLDRSEKWRIIAIPVRAVCRP